MVSDILAIIVAAGSGRRFGTPLPKQFCMLGDRPVLAHTIGNLRACLPGNARIALVLHPDYFSVWDQLAGETSSPREDCLVGGGATRAESVANAISACAPEAGTTILVHDGVRPFVTEGLIRNLLAALDEGAECAIPATPLTDSIRQIEDAGSRSVDRSSFRAVQTPQAFPATILEDAYRIARRKYGFEAFTDDASVVERCIPGAKVVLAEGSPYNMKITNPLDLKIAEALL
ncbi:MAG: 2-C-methyl-D-erythritol 4-phosphate cytidylyltransferase [Muribaculaceae bacterium]|nr:2-C-methyl-D-erythritol 4-phosphate cytidylyltransferase [Muribaculaceae bacterium]